MDQYDIGKIFAWVAQLAGLKNIKQFKVKVQDDEVVAREAERGNIIPIAPRNTTTDPTIVPESGQIPRLGTSG